MTGQLPSPYACSKGDFIAVSTNKAFLLGIWGEGEGEGVLESFPLGFTTPRTNPSQKISCKSNQKQNIIIAFHVKSQVPFLFSADRSMVIVYNSYTVIEHTDPLLMI